MANPITELGWAKWNPGTASHWYLYDRRYHRLYSACNRMTRYSIGNVTPVLFEAQADMPCKLCEKMRRARARSPDANVDVSAAVAACIKAVAARPATRERRR